jgi:hypothetical protein
VKELLLHLSLVGRRAVRNVSTTGLLSARLLAGEGIVVPGRENNKHDELRRALFNDTKPEVVIAREPVKRTRCPARSQSKWA